MKKLLTFVMMLILATTAVFGGLVGCNRGESEDFDNTKSHLYLGIYNAGFGTEYANDLKRRFEEFYAEESFEEGKVGVQVHVLDVPQGNAFIGSIEDSEVEVFFTSNSDYYQFVNRGYILNIDDVVTGSLSKYGDVRTIESRLSQQMQDFFKTDNGYYAVPYVTSYSGMGMNVDLFEDNDLYFAKGGCPSEYLRTNPNCDDALDFPEDVTEWSDDMYEFTGTGEKSAGPDGKYNTPDDGEPATYEEFFAFCDHCYDSNIQAFHWPGKYDWTFSATIIQMAADYEGVEQFSLNYNFNGTAKTIVEVDEDGVVTRLPELKITNENGYKLVQQESKYYVLSFLEELLSRSNYYDVRKSLEDATHTHTDAQDDFVTGGILPNQPEIALLVDGEWWWNEAQPGFKVAEEYSKGAYKTADRRFKMLSFPKATNEKVGEPFTALISGDSICAINANIESAKERMAKEFVKFAFTNESNLQFTKITSCARPYEYDIPDGYLEGLNYFAQNVMKTYDTAERCFVGSENPMYISNAFNFFNQENFWSTKIDGSERNTPMTELVRNNVTAIEYFNGMQAMKDKTFWDNRYTDYYGKN